MRGHDGEGGGSTAISTRARFASAAVRLVLVGGGHSHVLVLRSLGEKRDPSLQVTLVAPSRYATYSGMVPGVIAGLYRLAEAQIDLDMLARRAGGTRIAGCAIAVDARHRVIELAGGARLSYDLAAFNIGSQPARMAPVDPAAPLLALKPMDDAVAHLERSLASPPPAGGRRVVVVGAGAAGTEVSFALAARLRHEPNAAIVLCDAAAQPVLERGRRTAALIGRALRARGIEFVGGVRAERVTADGVYLDDGRELPAHLVVWATGAGGTEVLTGSGLAVDRRGFLLVHDTLQCPSHAALFASGDCATLIPYPDLAKAGVYAVRQAPVLDHNLRAAAGGGLLRAYRPQRRFLALLNTCDGRAVLSYGRAAWHGRAAWRLKDWIDRRFIAQFR